MVVWLPLAIQTGNILWFAVGCGIGGLVIAYERIGKRLRAVFRAKLSALFPKNFAHKAIVG